jgi:transposase
MRHQIVFSKLEKSREADYHDEVMSRHDIDDSTWGRLSRLLPPERSGKQGRPLRDNRVIVNALIRILRTGAPWRDLPSEYGPWQSVYTRFRRWEARGIWQRALEELAKDATDNESLTIDSTARPCPSACRGSKGEQEKQAFGRSRGGFSTEIHAIVDALGNPLRSHLTGGNVADIAAAPELLDDCDVRTHYVLGDKSYDSDEFVGQIERRGSSAVIPSRSNRKKPGEHDSHNIYILRKTSG